MATLPGIERALLETLAYSDIFDYPLRLDELHRYLTAPAAPAELPAALSNLRGRVGEMDGFFFLAGRSEIVGIRKERERRARPLFARALRYGRILGGLPFIRMAALTGSLATLNFSGAADFDYMLVTARGRVWSGRAFALAFNRLTRLRGYTLCPNLIVSETALEWPLHDLYSARELCQMIPIAGLETYRRLRAANRWSDDILPNAQGFPPNDSRHSFIRDLRVEMPRLLFEFPLRASIGERFEGWERTRKIARLSRQPGFGEETVFSADICQGNFHHHRRWVRQAYEERLAKLGLIGLDSKVSRLWNDRTAQKLETLRQAQGGHLESAPNG